MKPLKSLLLSAFLAAVFASGCVIVTNTAARPSGDPDKAVPAGAADRVFHCAARKRCSGNTGQRRYFG